MKNLIKLAIGVGVLSGVSQGATVLVATGLAGTSVQGVSLTTSFATPASALVDSSNYYVAVGRYVSGVFTPWVGTSASLDTATGSPAREVSGSFSTSTGTAFDGLQIHVFVGLLSTIATNPTLAFTPTGTAWSVLTQTTASVFAPSAGSGSTTVNFTVPSVLSVVAEGAVANGFNGDNTGATSGTVTNYFYLVPEPSTALLGAIGALGLLRRRRI